MAHDSTTAVKSRPRGATWRLRAGDWLAMQIAGPVEFRNPTPAPARHLVAIASEAPRRPSPLQTSR